MLQETSDELLEMTLNLFGDVDNKNVPVPEWKEHPCGTEELKVGLEFLNMNRHPCERDLKYCACQQGHSSSTQPILREVPARPSPNWLKF